MTSGPYSTPGLCATTRFLADEAETIALLRSCFTGLYSLDPETPGIEEVKAKAIAQPHDYLLKPQREGGGNLIHGLEMKHALETYSPEQLAAYILMDRISPQPFQATLVRRCVAQQTECASELGIYTAVVAYVAVQHHRSIAFMSLTRSCMMAPQRQERPDRLEQTKWPSVTDQGRLGRGWRRGSWCGGVRFASPRVVTLLAR